MSKVVRRKYKQCRPNSNCFFYTSWYQNWSKRSLDNSACWSKQQCISTVVAFLVKRLLETMLIDLALAEIRLTFLRYTQASFMSLPCPFCFWISPRIMKINSKDLARLNGCAKVRLFSMLVHFILTFITLRANSADHNLIIFFFHIYLRK